MAESGNTRAIAAPELQTSEWLNTPEPLTLAGLRGKVVVLHTFQIFLSGLRADGNPAGTEDISGV